MAWVNAAPKKADWFCANCWTMGAGPEVPHQRHVGGEHALPVHQVPVVLVVEHVRSAHVEQLHPVCDRCTGVEDLHRHREGALPPASTVHEVVAVRPADGVRAGERHQLHGLPDAPAGEGLQEPGGLAGRRWDTLDDVLPRGRGQAVEPAQGYGVQGPAGQEKTASRVARTRMSAQDTTGPQAECTWIPGSGSDRSAAAPSSAASRRAQQPLAQWSLEKDRRVGSLWTDTARVNNTVVHTTNLFFK
jgi:hypothetical protein